MVPGVDDSNVGLSGRAETNGRVDEDTSFAGHAVELHGLRSTERNGLVGRAGTLDTLTGRYPVRLTDGSRVAIKPENLRKVSETSEESAPRQCPCPLCGAIIVATSEEQCVAHMSQCPGIPAAQRECHERGEIRLWPPPKAGSSGATQDLREDLAALAASRKT